MTSVIVVAAAGILLFGGHIVSGIVVLSFAAFLIYIALEAFRRR